MCISEKSSTQTYSFGTTSLNSNLFLVINASVGGDILHVDLTTTQPSYWKVLRRTEEKPLAVDDSVLQNFCRIQNEFCGLPHSGVDSYIVTTRSNINRFLHLPHLLLYEVRQNPSLKTNVHGSQARNYLKLSFFSDISGRMQEFAYNLLQVFQSHKYVL